MGPPSPLSRIERKSLILFAYVVLDYESMVRGPIIERMRLILQRISTEVPYTIEGLNLRKFDSQGFNRDFLSWLEWLRPLLANPPPEPVDEEEGWQAERAVSIPVTVIVTTQTEVDPAKAADEALRELGGLKGRVMRFTLGGR